MTLMRIGGVYVFTREDAIAAYESLSRKCYATGAITPENMVKLFNAGVEMTKLGFTWDELDKIDFKVIKEVEDA